MAYFGVIFFANMRGGGGQNYFHLREPRKSRELSGPVLRDAARLSERYPHVQRYGVLGVSTSREFLKALETTAAMKRRKISCSCGSDC